MHNNIGSQFSFKSFPTQFPQKISILKSKSVLTRMRLHEPIKIRFLELLIRFTFYTSFSKNPPERSAKLTFMLLRKFKMIAPKVLLFEAHPYKNTISNK